MPLPLTQGELILLTVRQTPRQTPLLFFAVIRQVQRCVGPGRMELLCNQRGWEGSVPLPEWPLPSHPAQMALHHLHTDLGTAAFPTIDPSK